MLICRRDLRRARAPTPAFSQSGASTGSLPASTAGESVQIVVSSRTSALRSPTRQAVSPSAETPTSPILHLVYESSQGEEEEIPLKRRRIVVGDKVIENKEPAGGSLERVAVEKWCGFRRRDCTPFKCGNCFLVRGHRGRKGAIRGS